MTIGNWSIGAALARSYRSEGCMTLGELIEQLSQFDKNKPVKFDDEKIPCAFHSWRGSYDQLALSDNESPCDNVKELLSKAKEALTKEFGGYKGGEFHMNKDTVIHRANVSEVGKCFLAEVLESDDYVVLICKTDEDM